MVGLIKSPNWQYIPLIHQVYIAFEGVIESLPPNYQNENNPLTIYTGLIYLTDTSGMTLRRVNMADKFPTMPSP